MIKIGYLDNHPNNWKKMLNDKNKKADVMKRLKMWNYKDECVRPEDSTYD